MPTMTTKRSGEAPANTCHKQCRSAVYIILTIAALYYLRMPNTASWAEQGNKNPNPADSALAGSAAGAAARGAPQQSPPDKTPVANPSPGACSRLDSGLSATAANGKLIIDKGAIQNQPKERLEKLKRFTTQEYEEFFTRDAGIEHYPLWHYLTKTYHAANDCRHVVDIGTRYVASSLALGASGVTVKTFDIPVSGERVHAFRGKTEEAWQQELQSTENVHIEFHNLELVKVSDADFQRYMTTWLIVLDTFHEPYSVPFEREFLSRLVNLKDPFKFRGIMMLDDINHNDEMRRWWKEVQENAVEWGFVAYDLTSVGHSSGTGLLDFSGQVTIVEA